MKSNISKIMISNQRNTIDGLNTLIIWKLALALAVALALALALYFPFPKFIYTFLMEVPGAWHG